MTSSAAKLLLLKARLTDHAPFMEERISDATTHEELTEIALDVIKRLSDTKLRWEFGLGGQVAKQNMRVANASSDKKAKHEEISEKVSEEYLRAYRGWLDHPDCVNKPDRKQRAKGKAIAHALDSYRKLVGRSITWDALRRRIRPYLK